MSPQNLLRNLKQLLRNAGEEATASVGKAEKGTPKKYKNNPFSLYVNINPALVKH